MASSGSERFQRAEQVRRLPDRGAQFDADRVVQVAQLGLPHARTDVVELAGEVAGGVQTISEFGVQVGVVQVVPGPRPQVTAARRGAATSPCGKPGRAAPGFADPADLCVQLPPTASVSDAVNRRTRGSVGGAEAAAGRTATTRFHTARPNIQRHMTNTDIPRAQAAAPVFARTNRGISGVPKPDSTQMSVLFQCSNIR